MCIVPRIDGLRCAKVTSGDGSGRLSADSLPLHAVHTRRTEGREETGRRLARGQVRRTVSRAAPFEHRVRVVSYVDVQRLIEAVPGDEG